MPKPLCEIVRFQVERELDKKPYDALNEHINIFEELLESIGLDVPKENRPMLSDALQDFISRLTAETVAVRVHDHSEIPIDEKVDAYCDIIVFAVGAIMKLGYEPELALTEVAKEINSREGKMIDGKFEKDLTPEAKAKWYKANYAECKTKEI